MVAPIRCVESVHLATSSFSQLVVHHATLHFLLKIFIVIYAL